MDLEDRGYVPDGADKARLELPRNGCKKRIFLLGIQTIRQG